MIVSCHRVALVLPPPLQPRTPGVHLSDIIRCMALDTGVLKTEAPEDATLVDARTITDPIAITRICMGLAWEEWYIRQLPDVVDHPGEMQLEGVYMTPDGEELTILRQERRLTLRLHECKLTYKSLNTVGSDPEIALLTQFMWLWQMRGYCKALGTRFASLHVLFVCGDYSWPQSPQPWRYDVEFTQDEIDADWQMMTEYRDYLLARSQGEVT